MKLKKTLCCVLTASMAAFGLTACSSGASSSESQDASDAAWNAIDMTAWNYEQADDVYWQTGISYCQNPADEQYESLGIYVPGAYLTGTQNDDGTFTCEVASDGDVEGFTAQTAPIVLPVETPGYMAMNAPSGYEKGVKEYTDAGYVYVYAGCRGRDAGAPAGVTDLKAAIRYVRSNDGAIPGDMDKVFCFGMSGGGAQSAVLGASGDSELFDPYLQAIGAVEDQSDAVDGAMCWCPVTSLDYASEAYEWNMGSTRTGLDDEMQALSDSMAMEFALHVNDMGLTDENGTLLTLEESADGVYQSGTYYDYLKSVIEKSLDSFLADTEFPYTVTESKGPGGFGTFGGQGAPDGDGSDGDVRGDGTRGDGAKGFPGGPGDGTDGTTPGIDGDRPLRDGMGGFGNGGPNGGGKGTLDNGGAKGNAGSADAADGTKGADGDLDYEALDGIERTDTNGGITLTGTYDTPQAYIDALNADGQWVTYDSATNTVSITSIADFANALKRASKSLGAFDALDESQGENVLFGDGDGEGDHFDANMAKLLEGTEYADAYAEDLKRTDEFGASMQQRVQMYDPLYYILKTSEGYETSDVAPYWRIRTGINQGDTALTTEVDLALALENYGADVDFETVWGQAHVKAERTGDSDENFIAWVKECCAA